MGEYKYRRSPLNQVASVSLCTTPEQKNGSQVIWTRVAKLALSMSMAEKSSNVEKGRGPKHP